MPGDKLIKLVGIRRAMVKSMTDIKKVPALNLHDDICIEELKKLRALYMRLFPKEKITMLPFMIKAFSIALLDFPIFNAHVSSEMDSQGYLAEYTLKSEHNISLAMDTPDGLIVPNIKGIQNKSILQINADIKNLIEKTKKGKVTKEDLKDGTFTVSNIGSIGTRAATALLFRPQTGIAAICQTRLEPVFTLLPDGKYKVTPSEVFTMCTTCDHRIIDGAAAAGFNKRVKQLMENPELMSLYLK
jgi:2-oxoisovalerate dehydrogenase E2 component (dihydrolipoyl transacylase)